MSAFGNPSKILVLGGCWLEKKPVVYCGSFLGGRQKIARNHMASRMIGHRHKGALRSIFLDAPHDQLWSLSDPDVVWNHYKEARDNETDLYGQFFKHVLDCIEKRMARTRVPAFNPADEGRWLSFNPYFSMFEDVAAEETNGFYGAGDCPPPEFWTYVDDEQLVSFIPKKYVTLANTGVELCVAENVEWVLE